MKTGLILAACLMAPTLALAQAPAPPSASELAGFDRVMSNSQSRGALWRALKADFPQVTDTIAKEAIPALRAGRNQEGFDNIDKQMKLFVGSHMGTLARAPDASLIAYASATARLLTATKARSIDACAAAANKTPQAAPAERSSEEAAAADALEVVLVHGVKAGMTTPVNRPMPMAADGPALLAALKSVGLSPAEAGALDTHADISTAAPIVQCDLLIHMMQAAPLMPPDAAGRFMAQMAEQSAAPAAPK